MEIFGYTLRYYEVSYSRGNGLPFDARKAFQLGTVSKRERWFRGWIGQSYENAVGYWLPGYTMSFKENPFTAEPGPGPCPRYSNGSHSYRSNCRYCHRQDPIIPRADIATWKRWQLPIHFSDVFISLVPAPRPLRPTIAPSRNSAFEGINAVGWSAIRHLSFLNVSGTTAVHATRCFFHLQF